MTSSENILIAFNTAFILAGVLLIIWEVIILLSRRRGER
jgi:hypothetical protein